MGAWLLVQVAETVLPVFDVPAWVLRAVIIALALITYQLMRAVKARLYPWETQA